MLEKSFHSNTLFFFCFCPCESDNHTSFPSPFSSQTARDASVMLSNASDEHLSKMLHCSETIATLFGLRKMRTFLDEDYQTHLSLAEISSLNKFSEDKKLQSCFLTSDTVFSVGSCFMVSLSFPGSIHSSLCLLVCLATAHIRSLCFRPISNITHCFGIR